MSRAVDSGRREGAAPAGVAGARRRRLVGLLCRCVVAVQALATPAAADRPAAPGTEPIAPVPRIATGDPAKVRLGERLFHDPRLSRGNDVACASCHDLEQGGDDGRARAAGADGRPLAFNTPTVFNAALSFRLNWRGNFLTLEEQAEAVLLDPRLMGTTWPELLGKLRADPAYRAAFGAVYGGEPGPSQVLDALASFERSLLTPDAPFDRWLAGERDAITPAEARGYELFKAYGCAACHQGVNVGANLFQKFGIFADPFARRPSVSEADLGRLALTGDAADRHVFRVPGLRNVAVTAPYLHDGSVATLEEAVDVMARNQLGRAVPEEDVALIVRFLRTLTGEHRGGPLATGETTPGPPR